jgi:hypothetical protein
MKGRTTGASKPSARSEGMDTEGHGSDDDDGDEDGLGGPKGDFKEFNYSENLSFHVS